MTSRFENYPNKPQNTRLAGGYNILCYTHETCSSFLNIFDKSKNLDNLTAQDQDLLRAILTFASAGLDSLVKQLIKDTLCEVICRYSGSEIMFKRHVERIIMKGNEIDGKILANAFISQEPKDYFISKVIWDLTSNSLQSKDELLKVASYFDIPSNILVSDLGVLKEIFDIRNQIVHEMDIDLSDPKHRRERVETAMIIYTNELFKIAETFLNEVDSKLS